MWHLERMWTIRALYNLSFVAYTIITHLCSTLFIYSHLLSYCFPCFSCLQCPVCIIFSKPSFLIMCLFLIENCSFFVFPVLVLHFSHPLSLIFSTTPFCLLSTLLPFTVRKLSNIQRHSGDPPPIFGSHFLNKAKVNIVQLK